jgi:hypothetical protein
MELEPVVSSNIAAIGFDDKTNTMHVKFTNGQMYEAVGAKQVDFDNFKLAKSKGSHFAKILKRAFVWTKVNETQKK